MLPGMERRLTEHMMVHHAALAASEASGRSLQEVPLLKGSFGHHSAIGGLGNSSSQESLYGNQRHHIMTSGSLHSIRSNRTASASTTIPVTAEIVPVPVTTEPTNVRLVSSASSSFMPASEAVANNPSAVTSPNSQ